MDTMTGYQRTLSAFALEDVDRIPFHAYESPEHAMVQFGHRVHEMYLDPELLPESMIYTAKLYENDIIYMRAAPYLNGRIAERTDDGLVIKDARSRAITARVLADTKTILPIETPRPLVASFSDIEKISVTSRSALLASQEWKSLSAYVHAFKGERFLFGFACGQSANAIDQYLGTEEAMIAAMTDTGLCRAIMDRRYEQLKEQMIALRDIGADGAYTGDACASCSFFSPETYRTLFFEYQKKGIDFAHSLGLKALLHICGKIGPILEDMADTGADVIESLDVVSSGGDIDLAEAKARVGHRICLKGNIDAVHVIERQTPEAVSRACMDAIAAAGPNGYILSTEQITRDTPRENVLAMCVARNSARCENAVSA